MEPQMKDIGPRPAKTALPYAMENPERDNAENVPFMRANLAKTSDLATLERWSRRLERSIMACNQGVGHRDTETEALLASVLTQVNERANVVRAEQAPPAAAKAVQVRPPAAPKE